MTKPRVPNSPENSSTTGADYLRSLFASLRLLVLERKRPGLFQSAAHPPAWLKGVVSNEAYRGAPFQPGETFPFLDNFLLDAERFWAQDSAGVLHSGPWVEISLSGRELHLEAKALSLAGVRLLLVEELGQRYRERRDLLQKARQNSLTHQRLVREIQFKEVLLHCIVHDLAGPLMGIKGLFSLLRREQLSEAGQRRLKIGEDASQKMENLVHEILEVFSAEVEALEVFSMDWNDAPDLMECTSSVVDTLHPAAELKGIELEVSTSAVRGAPLKVAGEHTRLERVLFNLMENALRHSPPGGQIVIAVEPRDETVHFSVSDEGSGVEADRAPLLFQRFMQGGRRSGKAGLGLYFCRIMVERWGGKIGYQPRQSGGSRFWFELPRIPAAEATATDRTD